MEIAFDTKLVNLAGVTLKMDNEDATLKMVAVAALVGFYQDENPPGAEKAIRHRLAKRIYAGEKNLTATEVEKVKFLIGKGYPPLIVGAAYDILEGVDQVPAPAKGKKAG